MLISSLPTINNVTLSNDFYTALINIGSFVINMTAKKNYIKEFSAVKLPQNNYLESALSSTKNGYGVEYSRHPELIHFSNKVSENKWIVARRISKLKGLLIKFNKLLIGLVLKRSYLGNEGEIYDEDEKTPDQIVDSKVQSKQGKTNEENCKSTSVAAPLKLLCLDDIDDDKLDVNLLMKGDLSEIDNSTDYVESGLPEESDAEFDDMETDNLLNELVTPDEFKSLIMPNNSDDIRFNRILNYHMEHQGNSHAVTRSRFNNYYNEEMKLLDLIRESRLGSHENGSSSYSNGYDLDDSLGTCVICHENSRQIILWPCKCLAICETCRINLFMRNFNDCVCCRSKVEGYSKVYVP
ncbi:unnamed protein product [Ambrosiozyma monospora]|uniref:Unnamed protein product n=1 Tax=Ambrosiozyma monospora TaxID=43982 RepID=A0A9W6YMC9_AMBMO|nr:unnamed protein product [Ambrosiozyma monospora]